MLAELSLDFITSNGVIMRELDKGPSFFQAREYTGDFRGRTAGKHGMEDLHRVEGCGFGTLQASNVFLVLERYPQ